MIHDLTDTFLQALKRKGQWKPEEASGELAALAKQEGCDFQWGRTTGEEWMAIDSPSHGQYALIWTHAPLAIMHSYVSMAIRDFIERHNGQMIVADGWHVVAYRIDPDVIRAHGVPYFWPLDADDPTQNAFSILDLYDVTCN